MFFFSFPGPWQFSHSFCFSLIVLYLWNDLDLTILIASQVDAEGSLLDSDYYILALIQSV